VRRLNDPPPDIYADEPVVFRTGPHWMAYDTTVFLVAITAAIVAGTWLVSPEYMRFALIPAAALAIRLAIDLPRYWRFGIILTTRRLFVNVGTVRDIYHTINLKHVQSVEVRIEGLGRVLRYGEVELELEGVSPDGEVHQGTYLLDYVQRPRELAEALTRQLEMVQSGEAAPSSGTLDTEEDDVSV
jgi:uncharacterized membrane protein YdbT with pleckstrin-like domain